MKQVKPPFTNRQVRPARQLVYGLYKQFGQPGLDKIAANAVVTASSGTTYKGVAAGEYAVGMTLEYAAQEYVAGGQKEIKLVYPTEGSYLAPEGMFIIKGAKNLDAAKALYDGLLSKESQEAAATDYETVVAAWNQAVATAK